MIWSPGGYPPGTPFSEVISKKSVMTTVFLLVGLGATAAFAEPAETDAGILGMEKDIYEQHCAACHSPSNIMVAFPKLHNRAQWSARLEAGFETVLGNAIRGITAMPPMGGCETCTEEEIEAAIRYMAAPALPGPEATDRKPDALSDRPGS